VPAVGIIIILVFATSGLPKFGELHLRGSVK